ncbi:MULTISPECIES: tRNA1(Val) (adenine(37)-N6)-methyltransferase [unclassified Arsukibacterium]|uniref:tRNA1(Val) (adenine(37)-N6)-methyltransferase n=2 Tax=Arsukibacterium TaxID=336830 RepID=UPI0025C5D5FB|nr:MULTISPECIES: methyltransferase [unclassified Arsukibacterium]|tara:strand:- start:335 stop:1090 length:756 start_codon:yes stop_codon:yes gene_type:complete
MAEVKMSSGFKCKQFFVGHAQCAMKVGTDGLLLGAWASLPTCVSSANHTAITVANTMLDIGTGSGLISLMLAQRAPDATIHAIELDPAAAAQASCNFLQSPFSKRLKLLKGDILTYQPAERYALIVSNPPFFDNALLSKDGQRNQARHTASLPMPLLLAKAAALLAAGGSFALVLPDSSAEAFCRMAYEQGWYLRVNCVVYSRTSKAPLRRLMQWQREPCCPQQQQLVIHDRKGGYTEQYRTLLREFYLNF